MNAAIVLMVSLNLFFRGAYIAVAKRFGKCGIDNLKTLCSIVLCQVSMCCP
jgi:hypothetical protein